MRDEASAVRIVDLSYAYPNDSGRENEDALDHIDLDIKKGEFVSIMGRTGAGKTTLCLALNGIIPHSTGGRFHGDVWIDGINTRTVSVPELADKVGVVFQDPKSQLFCSTVGEELAFGLENKGMPAERIDRQIKKSLGLVGMNDYAGRSPAQLSGGQKQRVAIAAMLAMEPEILILDEPTSDLDPEGTREVFRIVRRLKEEKSITIIMAEHESDQIAAFSDRVVVLDNGRIVMDGAPRDVFADPRRAAAFGVNTPEMAELAAALRLRGFGNAHFLSLEEAEDFFLKGYDDRKDDE